MSDETGSGASAQQQLQSSMLDAIQRMAASQERILEQARITSDATSRLYEDSEDERRQTRNSRSSSANQKGSQVTSQTNLFGKAMTKATIKYNKAARSGLTLDAAMKDLGKTVPAVASGVFKSMKNITKSVLESFGGVGKVILGTLQATAGVAFDIASGITGTIFAAFTSGFAAIGGIFSTIKDAAGSLLKGLGNIASGIFDIISQVGKMLVNVITSIKDAVVAVVDITIQLAKSAVNIVKGLLSAPYSMIEAALKLGNEIRREIKESIIQSLQDVKESFDLDSVVGQSFVRLNRTLAAARGAFQSESSEYVRLFGFGIQGLVAASKEATENIMALGPYAEYFSASMNKNLLFFTRIKRALNLTSEDMRYLAHDSFVTGRAITATYSDLSQTLEGVAKNHQIDLKRLSGSFFELRKDIQNFGHLTNLDLAQVTARMRQMGLEAKSATDLFNKFTTFEEAANSAALLSQVFGMNVDALRLIQAEGPDEIAQMFRESMLATGRTYQDLNRHEKALMSQYTGLGDEALRNLMSYQTMGMSVAEIRKQQEEQDPTQRMIRATRELTSAVRELQKAMTFNSPIEAFFSGLKDSVTLGGPLRSILTALSGDMVGIRNAGVRLGRDRGFVRFLKSIEKILIKIKNIFTDGSFTTTLETFTTRLSEVFTTILDPTKSSEDVEASINNLFVDVTGNSTFIGKMLKVGGNIAGYIFKGLGGAIPFLFNQLATVFKALFGQETSEITDGISSPFIEGLKESLGVNNNQELSGAFRAMFNRIKTSFLGFGNVFKEQFSDMLGLEGENRTWAGIGSKIGRSIIESIVSIFEGDNETVDRIATALGNVFTKAMVKVYNLLGQPTGPFDLFDKLNNYLERVKTESEGQEVRAALEESPSAGVIASSRRSESGLSEAILPDEEQTRMLEQMDLNGSEAMGAGIGMMLNNITTTSKENLKRSAEQQIAAFTAFNREQNNVITNDILNLLTLASSDGDTFSNMFADNISSYNAGLLSNRARSSIGNEFRDLLDAISEYENQNEGRNLLSDVFRAAELRNVTGDTPSERAASLADEISRQNTALSRNPLVNQALTALENMQEGPFGIDLPSLTPQSEYGPQIDEVISQRIRDDQREQREAYEAQMQTMNELLTAFVSRPPTTVPLYLNSTKVGEALIPSMLSGPTPLLQTSEGNLSVSTSQPVSPGTPSR